MKVTWDKIAALVVFLCCVVLIACSIDGEVKTLLAVSGGWIVKGAYDYRKNHKSNKP